MVSALMPSKNVSRGIEAVSLISDVHLVLAGDGPLRRSIDAAAAELLPGAVHAPIRRAGANAAALQSRRCVPASGQRRALRQCICRGDGVRSSDSRARDATNALEILGDDEFLADMDDPAAVAQAIKTADAYATAGREKRIERAAGYSWAKIGGMYAEFFHELLA